MFNKKGHTATNEQYETKESLKMQYTLGHNMTRSD